MLVPGVTQDLLDRFHAAIKSVDRDIHPLDNMYSGSPAAYLSIGKRALALICEAYDREQRLPVSILDFPSGWGRVTRWLRAAFPDIVIGAGDVWHEAVEHTSKTCNASCIKSDEDLSKVDCPTFDCIFTGSLATHLSEAKTRELIDWLIAHLEPGGLAIVTSHGRVARDKFLAKPKRSAFSTDDQLASFTDTFNAGGYAFQPYVGRADAHMKSLNVSQYGLSLVSPIWWMGLVLQRNDVALVNYIEAGWNRHQDVLILKKS
jgi:hypothetical protein